MARKAENKQLVLGSLSELPQMDVASIPITEFSYNSDSLPIAASVLNKDYSLVIDPLQVKPVGTEQQGRTTSLVRSQTVEEFLYATHIGVVVIPDAKQFALNGVDIAALGQNSDTPQFDGFVPPTGVITNAVGPVRDASARPAQLVWGHDTLQAAWALLKAYELVMKIGSRYEIFRELCDNVGACVSGEMRGFGQSLISPVPYIEKLNANERARTDIPSNEKRTFLPPTVTAGEQGPTPAAPPLVPVSYGGQRLTGAFGGWYPLRGLLLSPGMPINIMLERAVGDQGPNSYYARMQAALGNTQDNFNTYDANLNGTVTGNVGFAGSKVWKGGLFRIGILIRGFALSPLACFEGYQDMSRYFTPKDKAAIYAQSTAQMQEMASELARDPVWGPKVRARLASEQGTLSLDEYLTKKGGKLAGLTDIEDMVFGDLNLAAPLRSARSLCSTHPEGRRDLA